MIKSINSFTCYLSAQVFHSAVTPSCTPGDSRPWPGQVLATSPSGEQTVDAYCGLCVTEHHLDCVFWNYYELRFPPPLLKREQQNSPPHNSQEQQSSPRHLTTHKKHSPPPQNRCITIQSAMLQGAPHPTTTTPGEECPLGEESTCPGPWVRNMSSLLCACHAHTSSITCSAHTHACTLGLQSLRPPRGVVQDLQYILY